jgi:hypothetical protein
VSLLAALVGAALVVGLTLGLGSTWLGLRAPARSGSPTATSTSTVSPSDEGQQVAALKALLNARARAAAAHDRAGWMAAVDPRSRGFAARQAAAFDNFAAVPFSSWSYEYLSRAPELSPARSASLGGHPWVARVLAGYEIEGFDSSRSTVEQYLTVVQREGRTYLSDDTDGGTAPQPWDLGRVRLVHGDRVLAMGTAPTATLSRYAAAGDRAVARVTQVWGAGWSRRAVLVVPRTQAEFGKLLLRQPAGLDQVAAVTTGDLGGTASTDVQHTSGGRAGNDRVVLNPAAFTRLSGTGQRVVMTHEMTHVAVRQSTSAAVPIWLSEGFADFVGYRGTGVSRRLGAGDLLVLVRSGHGPRSLPTAADFDPSRTTIAPSYSGAWLACSRIADEHGSKALVALYRRAASPQNGSDGDPNARLATAFPEVLHTSVAAFTKDWRRYLSQLAEG